MKLNPMLPSAGVIHFWLRVEKYTLWSWLRKRTLVYDYLLFLQASCECRKSPPFMKTVFFKTSLYGCIKSFLQCFFFYMWKFAYNWTALMKSRLINLGMISEWSQKFKKIMLKCTNGKEVIQTNSIFSPQNLYRALLFTFFPVVKGKGYLNSLFDE